MTGYQLQTTQPPYPASRRLEIHNIEIDQSVAASHQCGTVHLPTGRVCMLPERHRGGCQFTAPASARSAT